MTIKEFVRNIVETNDKNDLLQLENNNIKSLYNEYVKQQRKALKKKYADHLDRKPTKEYFLKHLSAEDVNAWNKYSELLSKVRAADKKINNIFGMRSEPDYCPGCFGSSYNNAENNLIGRYKEEKETAEKAVNDYKKTKDYKSFCYNYNDLNELYTIKYGTYQDELNNINMNFWGDIPENRDKYIKLLNNKEKIAVNKAKLREAFLSLDRKELIFSSVYLEVYKSKINFLINYLIEYYGSFNGEFIVSIDTDNSYDRHLYFKIDGEYGDVLTEYDGGLENPSLDDLINHLGSLNFKRNNYIYEERGE